MSANVPPSSVPPLSHSDPASDSLETAVDLTNRVHTFLDAAISTNTALDSDSSWMEFLGNFGQVAGIVAPLAIERRWWVWCSLC